MSWTAKDFEDSNTWSEEDFKDDKGNEPKKPSPSSLSTKNKRNRFTQEQIKEFTKPSEKIDDGKIGNIDVAYNILPIKNTDNVASKIGKGIVNYGAGVVGRTLSAPGQLLMNLSANATNLIEGKPQNWGEKDYIKDILPTNASKKITDLQTNNPILGGFVKGAIDTVTDPTTFVGGGILDDLAKAGTIGKAAKIGTTENLLNVGNRNAKMLPKKAISDNMQKPISTKIPSADSLKSLENNQTYKEISEELKGTNIPSDEFVKSIAPTIKDKSGIKLNLKDPYRNFRDAFDKNFDYVKKKYLDPLDLSKKNYVDEVKLNTDKIYNDVVKKLGIKKGSKESAAIQWFGEKKRISGYEELVDPQTGKKIKKAIETEYTESDLIEEFGKEKAAKIKEADTIFREQYDELIDKLNKSREQIYPNVEAKVKEVNQKIEQLKEDIYNKTAERFSMEQGRIYQTNKEIDIQSQINNLNKQKNTLEVKLKTAKKPEYKTKLTEKIKSIETKIPLKEAELKKANLYGQPTAKQFEKVEDKISRLEELLKEKEELIKSEELWRGKRIPKRKDYYHHFQEMAEGFQGLKNIFDTPSQISPKLAGVSEQTKPNSKFLGLAQRQGKGKFSADAVGGMLNYIQPASYAIHIDPNIAKFRQLAKDIADGTAETKNANNTIEWLNDFSNSLAGKTNALDRVFQKYVPGGRTTFRALNWLNNRVKGNQVLGNAASAISQVANVPIGISRIKNPKALTKGLGQTMAGVFGKSNIAMKDSQFINERYMQNLISRFDSGIFKTPQKMAAWVLEGADKLGTGFIWNSAYNKAVNDGLENPVKYADDMARSIVAGRGVGEVPLIQQAKTFQIIAPFQLEVANLWSVFGDQIKEKDFAGIVLLLLGNYMFNNITESTTGNRVTFDPVNAMIEALNEEDTTPLLFSGRLAGEALSNIPLGQTLASIYPENKTDISSPIGSLSLPSRKELFGDNDPTRFGSGLLATKALTDPVYKILPPFGGSQAKKTIEGLQSVSKGMVEKNGKMSFPVSNDPLNVAKAALFGKYGTKEAQAYYDKNRRPLTEKETKAVMASRNPQQNYEQLQTYKRYKTEIEKARKLKNESKAKKLLEEYEKYLKSLPN